jgi:chromosome segregation ATPase
VVAALTLLPLLAGCSVFGIATRRDLQEQQDRHDRRVETLNAELETISSDLEQLEDQLGPRLAKLESEVDAFGDVSARMIAIDEALKAARQELAIVEGRVSRDLREFENDLQEASAAGQRVADAYLEDLRTRRRDLRRQMEELDTALANWDRVQRESFVPSRQSPPVRSGSNAIP